jgi:hypothetical protein
LCCGRHRRRDIACPPACPYLENRAPGREAGIAGRDEEEFWADDRLVRLLHAASRPLWLLAERLPAFTDADAAAALEYARNETARPRSLIILPGTAEPARHEAGEAVLRSLEEARFEGRIVLAGRDSSFSREDKLKVLDVLLAAATSFSRRNPRGRGFLDRLAGRAPRPEGAPGPGNIVTNG